MENLLKKLTCLFLSMAMILCLLPAVELQVSAAEAQSGTFTAVAMNVDGMPNQIKVNSVYTHNLNSDGPGSDGTTAISQKMATYGWDLIATSENFNYSSELMSALSSQYSQGTNQGSIPTSWSIFSLPDWPIDTDGLNLLWRNAKVSVSGEQSVSWQTHYSTDTNLVVASIPAGNGADGMIDKGYRYYQATINGDIVVDVYILHMDADSDAEDIAAREAQLTQLANAIKASNNGNPIVVIGDTNCRYTRENLKTLFIDAINADARFTVHDPWVELIRSGEYPAYGSDAIVASDKGGTYAYPQAEVVDKIFYINNTESDVTLTANSYTVQTDFVNSDGTALADHWPIVVEFGYTIAGEHVHNHVETSRTDATCTTAGSVTYTCDGCDDSYTEQLAATGHNYNSAVTKEPGCETAGETTYTCANCGDSYTQAIADKGGHSYTSEVTKAATCEEAGVKTYTCGNCGDSYTEAIPAAGHSYTSEVTKAATCEEAGVKTYTCGNCGDSYTEAILATGHSYTSEVTKAATCEEAGVKTYTCGNCGDSYTEAILATGHSYTSEVTKAATCEEAGVKTYTCGNCGDSYTEAILATGHSYTSEVTKAATCEEAGVKTYTCGNCGDSYTESIPATGHVVVIEPAVEADCTTAGSSEGQHCSDCGEVLVEAVEIEALGHDYIDGECTRCGELEHGTVATLGETVSTITSGKQYAIVFAGTTGSFSLDHTDNEIAATKFKLSYGDEVPEDLIWTITKESGKYVISTEIDGVTYYLYRTRTFYVAGYRIGLTTSKDSATLWTRTVQSNGSVRFTVKSGVYTYYLRYQNASVGWLASRNAGGVYLYEIEMNN